MKASRPGLRAEVEALLRRRLARSARRRPRPRQGPRPHRGPPRLRLPQRRLAERPAYFPGEHRFPNVAAVAKIETRTSSGTLPPRDPLLHLLAEPICINTSPRRSAATGASRTPCTGCSTSPSTKINRACAKAMGPRTWPWSATSPSISSDRSTTSDPSSCALLAHGRNPNYLTEILQVSPLLTRTRCPAYCKTPLGNLCTVLSYSFKLIKTFKDKRPGPVRPDRPHPQAERAKARPHPPHLSCARCGHGPLVRWMSPAGVSMN